MLNNTDNFQLKKTIGSSWITDQDDVQKTKSALQDTGDYKAPDWGITGVPDKDMFDGLKTFQKREGLEVDGVMKPGGPTEERLRQTTKKSRSAKSLTVSHQPQKEARKAISSGEWDPHRPGLPGRPKGDDAVVGGLPKWPEPHLPPMHPTGHIPNLGNRRSGSDQQKPGRDRSKDIEVALAPLIPAIAAGGGVLMRNGPKILRTLENIFKSAPPLIGAAEEARRRAEETEKGKTEYPSAIPQPPKEVDETSDQLNMDAAAPLPPTPGLEPPHELSPDREEYPEEANIGPTTEIFPIPGQREAILETFPIDDSLSQWIIMENSRGDEDTQAKNDIMIELLTWAFKKYGVNATHTNGGRTAVGKKYLKERFLKAINGIRAARPDGSFQIDENTWIDFNTVDNLKDGWTPDARELRALEKIRRLYEAHNENSDIVHFPKLKDMGLEEWREKMKPLVDEYVSTKWAKK